MLDAMLFFIWSRIKMRCCVQHLGLSYIFVFFHLVPHQDEMLRAVFDLVCAQALMIRCCFDGALNYWRDLLRFGDVVDIPGFFSDEARAAAEHEQRRRCARARQSMSTQHEHSRAREQRSTSTAEHEHNGAPARQSTGTPQGGQKKVLSLSEPAGSRWITTGQTQTRKNEAKTRPRTKHKRI